MSLRDFLHVYMQSHSSFMRFIRRGTETPFVHWTTVTLVSNVSNLHYTVGLRDLETTPTSISARSLIPR